MWCYSYLCKWVHAFVHTGFNKWMMPLRLDFALLPFTYINRGGSYSLILYLDCSISSPFSHVLMGNASHSMSKTFLKSQRVTAFTNPHMWIYIYICNYIYIYMHMCLSMYVHMHIYASYLLYTYVYILQIYAYVYKIFQEPININWKLGSFSA